MSEIQKPSRYHKLDPVAYAKGGAFGGPGTGKSVLWTLIIIGLYRQWNCKRSVLIFDSDRGGAYLEPLFRYANIPVEINDTDFSTKALTEDMRYAAANCDFLLIDSLADPWEEFMRSFIKTTKSGKQYIDRADWPLLYQEWGYQFEVPFKSLPVHAFWTSKPKAVYEQQYDAEASEKRGRDVMTAQKVDETASGGRARSAEFGPGLTVECYHNIVEGKTQREIHVTKDRFFTLTGKKFSFVEPITEKTGELDYAKLIDLNPTFKSFLPHFAKINPGGAHREISTEMRSGVFFQNGEKKNDGDFYAMRQQVCEEIQNLIVMKFPGQTGAEKAAKVKIVLFVFGATVWETIQKTVPIHELRAALYKLKAIVADDKLIEQIVAWDGVSTRPPRLVFQIDQTSVEIQKAEVANPVCLEPQEEKREREPWDPEPEPINENDSVKKPDADAAPEPKTKPKKEKPAKKEVADLKEASEAIAPTDAAPYPESWKEDRKQIPRGASLPWEKHTPLMLKAKAAVTEFKEFAIYEMRYKLIVIYDKPLPSDDKLFDELKKAVDERAALNAK